MSAYEPDALLDQNPYPHLRHIRRRPISIVRRTETPITLSTIPPPKCIMSSLLFLRLRRATYRRGSSDLRGTWAVGLKKLASLPIADANPDYL